MINIKTNYYEYIKEEYLKSEEVLLKKYFSQSEEEKKEQLPYMYSYLLRVSNYLSILEDLIEDEANVDLDRDKYFADFLYKHLDMGAHSEIIHELEKVFPEVFNKFADFLYKQINSHSLNIPDHEYPAWFFFSGNPIIIKNQWLIHFTNDADSIVSDGFIYGVYDIDLLGLTTHLSNIEKSSSGYNFAYDVNDYERYAFHRFNELKYGKEAVLFKCSGVKMWHEGDREPQVIFNGESAFDRVAITRGYNADYAVHHKNGEIIFEDDLEKVVDWVIRNYNQYKNVIG